MPKFNVQKALTDRQNNLATSTVRKIFSRKEAEQAILECFELIGGIPRLALWADNPENYGEFLKLWVKCLPKEQQEEGGRVIQYHSNIPQSDLNHGAKSLEELRKPGLPIDADEEIEDG